MIYCKHCHKPLVCQTQDSGHRYYRHPYTGCDPTPFGGLRAGEIEDIVWAQFGEIFDKGQAMAEAIRSAFPDKTEIEKLRREVFDCERKLKEIEKNVEDLVDLALQGTLKKATISKREDELYNQRAIYAERLENAQRQLNAIPDAKVESLAHKRMWREYQKIINKPATFERKYKILEWCLKGVTPYGPKGGVYVEGKWINQRRSKLVSYEINAGLRRGTRLIDAMKLMPKRTKKNILGKKAKNVQSQIVVCESR